MSSEQTTKTKHLSLTLFLCGAIIAILAVWFLGEKEEKVMTAPVLETTAAPSQTPVATPLQPDSESIEVSQVTETAVAETTVTDLPAVPEAQKVTESLFQNQEAMQATRRMYAAHASLRESSVDDPDSVENQRILQAMVGKALSSKTTE